MSKQELYPVIDLCKHYEAEISFIHELQSSGMVEITKIEEKEYVNDEMLSKVEHFMRLHYELSINFEGLEAIGHLLGRMEKLQQELQETKNRLLMYEVEG